MERSIVGTDESYYRLSVRRPDRSTANQVCHSARVRESSCIEQGGVRWHKLTERVGQVVTRLGRPFISPACLLREEEQSR